MENVLKELIFIYEVLASSEMPWNPHPGETGVGTYRREPVAKSCPKSSQLSMWLINLCTQSNCRIK